MSHIHLVMMNVDLNEGRGPIVPKFACEDRDLACRIAKDLELYGNQGQFNNVTSLEITKHYVFMEDVKKARDAILSKLTPAEIEILGITGLDEPLSRLDYIKMEQHKRRKMLNLQARG